MMLGRPVRALEHLDSAAALFARPEADLEVAEWRVLTGALGLPGVETQAVELGRSRLARVAAGGVQARAPWALAVDAYASEHDTARALRWAGDVERLAASDRRAARLARLLRAWQEAERGRFDSALAQSAPLLAYDSAGIVEDPFARALLRLRRAAWLLRRGDSAGAERELLWYENSDSGIEGYLQRELQPGEVDGVVSVLARLRRSRLSLARGDGATACALLRRVVELWKGADPAYRPLRAEADSLARGCGR
jgi:hypothetical protein